MVEIEIINGKKYKKCKEGQIRNPLTMRCIKDNKDKENDNYDIINGKKYKKCKDGQIRNPLTMRCIKDNKDKENDNYDIINDKKCNKDKKTKKCIKDVNKKDNEDINRFKLRMKMPLNYEFNKINVKKFLDACNEPFIDPETKTEIIINTRDIAKKIINNTQHISFEEFIRNLIKNIKKMLILMKNSDRPLFINIDVEKYKKKSNYWIYLYVIDYIKYKYPEINIILLPSMNINDKKLKNDDVIVFIDDCIYSGQQMSSYISRLVVEKNRKYKFYILCSYITDKGLLRILNGFKLNKKLRDSKLYISSDIVKPKNVSSILNYNEIKLLNSIYGNGYGFVDDKYLIYFDHKLADIVSTLTAFYSGIVPNAKNRYYINKKPDKLDIIPIFKNCENIRNVNMWKPNCPSTPYKSDNKDFMKIYKKLLSKKAKSLTISKKKVERKVNNSI